jgi:hypothetical protein
VVELTIELGHRNTALTFSQSEPSAAFMGARRPPHHLSALRISVCLT